MESPTKEFGITIGDISVTREKGDTYFSIEVKEDDGLFFDFTMQPKEILDLADALSIVSRLADLMPTTTATEHEEMDLDSFAS
jgi:hypothetical protein